MNDHEVFRDNQDLMQSLMGSAATSPDDEAVLDPLPDSSPENYPRTKRISLGALGCPTDEVRLKEEALEQLTNELVARIIQEYERALARGLPPSRAIASVVGWASDECHRIRV
jgi:hypothetical protein